MSLQISLAAETIAHIGNVAITNSMFTGFIAAIIVAIIMIAAARSLALYPGRYLTNVIDAISEALIDLMADVTHDRAKAIRFFPLLATFFLFILANNWLGLLPGFGSITVTTAHGTVPLLRGLGADLNATLALALISVILMHIYAVKELGLMAHLKKYISWNPMKLFIGLLEAISDISKAMSFSFRLFGNIFAGEVLLAVISYLLPLLAPLPFFIMEIFVGLIQALVFTMLSLVFLQIATSHHVSDST